MPSPIFTFESFEVHRLVHARGIGDVYAGRDAHHKRVAVKVYRPATDDRMERDVRAAAEIDHPALAPSLACGVIEGRRRVAVSPWIAGKDLASLLADARVDPVHAAAILSPLASALDALQEAQLVHRTIAPSKIRLSPDPSRRVVLVGFGARSLLGPQLASPAAIDYVAPELAEGVEIFADAYALAVLAFRMLTGRLPFPTRNNAARAIEDRTRDRAPSLCAAAKLAFAPELEAVIARGLAREPERRYASAGLFVEELRCAVDGARPYVTPDDLDRAVDSLLWARDASQKPNPRRARVDLPVVRAPRAARPPEKNLRVASQSIALAPPAALVFGALFAVLAFMSLLYAALGAVAR